MNSDTPSTRQATISAPGMACGACVRHIGKALGDHPGVTFVDISLPSRSVRVIFDPAVTLIEAIVNSIRKIGYHAELREDQQS